MGFTTSVFTILTTDVYETWFNNLRDARAAKRIVALVYRLAHGNPGPKRVLKHGVCEIKIDYGPGYRLYYTRRGNALVVLLCGGDKSTQAADIKSAERLANKV